MKNFKKATAFALAMTMVAGSSLTVFAAEETETTEPKKEGSVDGAGEVEGTLNTDVWNVELPTEVTDDTTYNFILDPEGLIKQTTQAAYPDKTFEEGKHLFFNNVATDKVNDYTSTSDAKEITNKSSYAVDVTVTSTVTPGTGISINPDSTFKDDTNPSIYLALTDGTDTVPVQTTGTAVLTDTMPAAGDGAYEVVYEAGTGDAKGTYKYQLKEDAADTLFSKYSFKLTGECNTAADWSEVVDVKPAVNVTYKVDKHEDTPAVVNPSIEGLTAVDGVYAAEFTKGKALNLTVNFGNQGVTAISSVEQGNALTTLTDNPNIATFTGNVVTVKSTAYAGASTGDKRYLRITLDNDAKLDVELTVK